MPDRPPNESARRAPARWLLLGVSPPDAPHDERQRVRFLRDFTARCLLVTVLLGLVVAAVSLASGASMVAVLVVLVVLAGCLQVAVLSRRLRRLSSSGR